MYDVSAVALPLTMNALCCRCLCNDTQRRADGRGEQMHEAWWSLEGRTTEAGSTEAATGTGNSLDCRIDQ